MRPFGRLWCLDVYERNLLQVVHQCLKSKDAFCRACPDLDTGMRGAPVFGCNPVIDLLLPLVVYINGPGRVLVCRFDLPPDPEIAHLFPRFLDSDKQVFDIDIDKINRNIDPGSSSKAARLARWFS